jgi:hypothetical protein
MISRCQIFIALNQISLSVEDSAHPSLTCQSGLLVTSVLIPLSQLLTSICASPQSEAVDQQRQEDRKGPCLYGTYWVMGVTHSNCRTGSKTLTAGIRLGTKQARWETEKQKGPQDHRVVAGPSRRFPLCRAKEGTEPACAYAEGQRQATERARAKATEMANQGPESRSEADRQ